MTNKLEGLEPKKVFHYFEAISQIPRRSGHEKQLSDYMVGFAKERGLEVHQDEYLNVIIKKPGTAGYEDAPITIIQGHLDMVCEQNEGTDHDFEKDPIDLVIEGAWLTANGTTLGADNGIAIAYAMALLDAEDIPHPPLEVVMTTDEEVGLTGALKMDKSLLKGSYFINLDSEEEGELTVGCAGGLKATLRLPISHTVKVFDEAKVQVIEIKNLKGGHSGVDIDKNRANADHLMGRILSHLRKGCSFRIVDFVGGSKDNVIPREAKAIIVYESVDHSSFENLYEEVKAQIKKENRTVEPALTIDIKSMEYNKSLKVFSRKTTDQLIYTLINIPKGIQTMSADLEGMVESSLNLGKCAVEGDTVVMLFAIRSNIRSLKYHMTTQLEWFAKQIGATLTPTADYPEWEFKPDSRLLDKAALVYEDMFNKKPLVKAIHAGLEPGAFLEKLPHLDAISFGPDMEEVHSPNERLHIESTMRTWEFLKALLKALK
ncbi:Aminoacyl-histidine dipeptidase [Petrocella atlantisensis]|uniref:Cytosol non-specific dipeptidase n=1 Tax=Petrocella atlantisensis TaxID=2173034 RepID=A0A3P7NS42_9FIRM|nr:aminoacyl-histidine dipeptidase [Petrocella atlantisensis]VDN46024.1 Aminoacyl-histidine dipeptidase [Petrocella atlantisensis]